MKRDLQGCMRSANGTQNRLSTLDRVAHDWYRFVLSFPPHLVRDYLQRFGISSDHTVLDPFCGTGTTIVECKNSVSRASEWRRTRLLILPAQ